MFFSIAVIFPVEKYADKYTSIVEISNSYAIKVRKKRRYIIICNAASAQLRSPQLIINH
jgi:hypothetical protein